MAPTYVALLRAVNVGGTSVLRTADLVALLRKANLEDVRTYIQSGNAVFRARSASAAGLSAAIRSRIRSAHGLTIEVIVRTLAEWERAIASNPYRQADANPKALHLLFLTSTPKKPDLAALAAAQMKTESFTLMGRVFYLFAPEGIGRSKLFSRVERSLGVSGTARNWRTCQKLLEIAHEVEKAGRQSPVRRRPKTP